MIQLHRPFEAEMRRVPLMELQPALRVLDPAFGPDGAKETQVHLDFALETGGTHGQFLVRSAEQHLLMRYGAVRVQKPHGGVPGRIRVVEERNVTAEFVRDGDAHLFGVQVWMKQESGLEIASVAQDELLPRFDLNHPGIEIHTATVLRIGEHRRPKTRWGHPKRQTGKTV